MYEKHGINHHNLPYNQKAPAITVANILTELSYDFDSFTLGLTGKSCYSVKSANLVLKLPQTIFINRESYNDECEFNASFDHEMKHLRVNKNILEKNISIFEEQLLNGMKYFISKHGNGPFSLKDLPEIKYNFYQYMQASLDVAVNITTEDIRNAQKKVDTKAEYNRVASLCNWPTTSTKSYGGQSSTPTKGKTKSRPGTVGNSR